jgi:anti-sigma factor RsiW
MHPDDDTLWRYVYGESPPDEAARIEDDARTDAALARRIEDLRVVRHELLAGAPELPDDFPDRVVAAALERPVATLVDLAEARRFLRRALVAAALLGAIGLTYLAVEVLPDLLAPSALQAHPDHGLLRR